LPGARQEKVLFFDQSPVVMTTINGGDGADTIQVVSTAAVDRTAFDASSGLITVVTKTHGHAGTTSTVQHIDVRDGKVDTINHFKLSYGAGTTGSLAFTINAGDLQT